MEEEVDELEEEVDELEGEVIAVGDLRSTTIDDMAFLDSVGAEVHLPVHSTPLVLAPTATPPESHDPDFPTPRSDVTTTESSADGTAS